MGHMKKHPIVTVAYATALSMVFSLFLSDGNADPVSRRAGNGSLQSLASRLPGLANSNPMPNMRPYRISYSTDQSRFIRISAIGGPSAREKLGTLLATPTAKPVLLRLMVDSFATRQDTVTINEYEHMLIKFRVQCANPNIAFAVFMEPSGVISDIDNEDQSGDFRQSRPPPCPSSAYPSNATPFESSNESSECPAACSRRISHYRRTMAVDGKIMKSPMYDCFNVFMNHSNDLFPSQDIPEIPIIPKPSNYIPPINSLFNPNGMTTIYISAASPRWGPKTDIELFLLLLTEPTTRPDESSAKVIGRIRVPIRVLSPPSRFPALVMPPWLK